ncbi:MAG: hypothetical protein IBJ00_03810 [Alphaproteobacteria bacterium]|nr:hypothetical protein [Alphaproteobacteria bacterium]
MTKKPSSPRRFKNIILLVTLLLIVLSLWLHHETVLKGIYPDYGIEPFEISEEGKVCKPNSLVVAPIKKE